jgi:hypothetical protein
LAGIFRWLRLAAARRRVFVSGECLTCGSCCGNLSLSRGSRWLRSEAEFKRLSKERPEYARFRIIGMSATGLLKFSCDCATNEGLCGDYENRPDFCRTYPDEDLYFMGGELPAHCGFRFETVPAFDKILKKELDRLQREDDSRDRSTGNGAE